jgi:hypothetical protein
VITAGFHHFGMIGFRVDEGDKNAFGRKHLRESYQRIYVALSWEWYNQNMGSHS